MRQPEPPTDLPGYASPAGAPPSQALTSVAGAQPGRPVVWQGRTKFCAAVPCDRCPSDLSHFRAQFSGDSSSTFVCLDCATDLGLDVYQPAAPIAPVAQTRVRVNGYVHPEWDDWRHGVLEDREEEAIRFLAHDIAEFGLEASW